MLPFDPISGINRTLSDQFTESSFHCPAAATAGYWASNGTPVYRYVFSGVFPEITAYPWIRAYHGSDIALILGLEREFAYQELGEETQKAARYLRTAIATFVNDPVEGLAKFGWPKYSGQGQMNGQS